MLLTLKRCLNPSTPRCSAEALLLLVLSATATYLTQNKLKACLRGFGSSCDSLWCKCLCLVAHI